jgi:hypothetical protein
MAAQSYEPSRQAPDLPLEAAPLKKRERRDAVHAGAERCAASQRKSGSLLSDRSAPQVPQQDLS